MATKSYSFQSAWHVNAPPLKVWQVLTATPFTWSDWWPELKDVQNMRITPGLKGTSFSCSWQAPIGYRLKTDITISKINYLKEVTLEADGDLKGTVTCHILKKSGRTVVDIDWQVDTTKSWMNSLSFVLRPFFCLESPLSHAKRRTGFAKILKDISPSSTSSSKLINL